MPPAPPGAGWVTYVRCHDDIGWAITEEDAGRVGENGHLHRRFLADFYGASSRLVRPRRALPARPAVGRGAHGGSAASLAGLEAALELGDELAVELAIRRLLLLHAVGSRRRAAARLHGRRPRAA